MSRVQAWTEIIDKVKSRLSNWKLKSLSIGGRLTLLKSVLGSIPIFHMSIFKVPLTVLRSLESIRCQFFNGHELKSNKSSWVKWNSVLAAKEKRWSWSFKRAPGRDGGGLSIKAFYGVDGEEIKVSNMLAGPAGGILLMNKPLKLLFPRIYALDNIKDATICMKLNEPSLDNNFVAALEEESSSLSSRALRTCSFRSCLIRVLIDGSGSFRGSGEFSVASIRRLLMINVS
ncbi:hypothetical protein Tco_0609128 [Tanacetum coccineum]